MDALLVCVSIITAFSVVINVILSRLETAGKLALAKRIDAWITWGYPVVCVVGTLLLVWYYFI
jgi:hypothetical protein